MKVEIYVNKLETN